MKKILFALTFIILSVSISLFNINAHAHKIEKGKKYTITYKNVPEGVSNPNPTSYIVGKKNIILKDLKRTDYVFKGWYNSDNEKVTSIPNHLTGNIILKAKWEENFAKSYKITYKNVPKGVTNPNPKNYIAGQRLQLEELTRPEYKFTGWFLNLKKVHEISAGVKGHITLVATWERDPYTFPEEISVLTITRKKKKTILSGMLSNDHKAFPNGIEVQFKKDGLTLKHQTKLKTFIKNDCKIELPANITDIKVRTYRRSNGETVYSKWVNG